jgi:hypothetical protein
MALQHVRSSTANKRPVATNLADGQLGINYHVDSPGLFAKDSNNTLIKIGPIHVGTTAPNATPAGSSGNSKGEGWLDTSGTNALLKVWNGTAWATVQPVASGTVVSTADTGSVTSAMIANGAITNDDVNASAGIVDTKLATISTAGKVSNSATTATNLNTASAIVARDASGNFSAGTITASLTGAVTGNASTATTLQTSRTINGTSFNGSANITTSSWGTSRTITIGSTGKAVDGSAAVSWSLSEIGAVAKAGDTMTGALTLSGDPTQALHAATKQYVDSLGSAVDALVYKGTLGTGGTYTTVPTTYNVGWTLRVITAGTYVGQVAEVGDLLVAIVSRSGSGNLDSDWTLLQANIDGAVVGPASSTDNHVALFNGTSGKSIKSSGVVLGNGTLTVNTSGTGLSGSGTFTANQSTNGTITITSNATSASTANAIVARDASGNFSAGTITAALSGNASTASAWATGRTITLTGDVTGVSAAWTGSADISFATAIAAGSIVNADINASAAIADTKLATISTAGKVSNSATTATNLNTASAIVARDASGNFTAGTITAALSGNASTASAWATGRTITLTGDVTGVSGAWTGSGNISFATAIAAGSIVNADVNAAAAIAGTKISPDFGSQAVSTTGTITGASLIPSSATVPTNGLFLPAANTVGLSTGSTERLRVTSTGVVLIGSTSAIGDAFSPSGVRLFTLAGSSASFGAHRNDNTAFSNAFIFTKARGTALETVQSGDTLGILTFQGANGTAFARAAGIEAYVDGTPSSTSMPGRLVFYTTPSGSNTPVERLKIESDGDVIVASDLQTPSINGGPLAGLRNAIINGNFDIWQRGTSFSSPANNAYVADRWAVVWNGTGATRTISRVAFTVGQTDVPGEPTYFLRWNQSVAGSNATFTGIQQRIESVRTFAGRQVRVSFYAKAASALTLPSIGFKQAFGTGGTPSPDVTTLLASSVSITTSWQKFSYAVTVPSISAQTLGTDGNDSLILDLGLPLNAAYTFDLSQVQIEPGPLATPFEIRPAGTELALCQRYYQNNIARHTCNTGEFVYFKTSMRATPTLSVTTTTGATVTASGGNYTGTDGFRVQATGSGDFTWTASSEL